jgi:multiple sugar transport system permease protein
MASKPLDWPHRTRGFEQPRARAITIRAIWRWRLTAIAILLTALMLFPLYWMVNVSLEPSVSLFHLPPLWFPREATWDGYNKAIGTQGTNLITSLIVSLGTVLLTLVLATPAAYALTHLRMRALWFVFGLFVAQMIPTIVLAQGLYGVFRNVGLLDTYQGLILADSTHAVPFAILILRAFMLSVPGELTDSAMIDGAGYWRILVHIVVPLSRNGIITAGLFAFLFAWGDFIYAFTISTQDVIVPVTVGIYNFIGAMEAANYNALMATAVLACIPTAVLLILAQRYISAGLTTGGLKG